MPEVEAAAVSARDELDRWLALVSNLIGVGLAVYLSWLYLPESWKMELRRAARGARAPFDAAAAQREARAEMMSDVLHVMTYGVPDQWAAQ